MMVCMAWCIDSHEARQAFVDGPVQHFAAILCRPSVQCCARFWGSHDWYYSGAPQHLWPDYEFFHHMIRKKGSLELIIKIYVDIQNLGKVNFLYVFETNAWYSVEYSSAITINNSFEQCSYCVSCDSNISSLLRGNKLEISEQNHQKRVNVARRLKMSNEIPVWSRVTERRRMLALPVWPSHSPAFRPVRFATPFPAATG